jgi:hypothetical protein
MVDKVEAETQEPIQDHLVSWLLELKVHNMNDTACVNSYILLINYFSPGINLLETILFSSLFDATKISRPINPSKVGNQLWCTKSIKVR